MHTSEFFEFKDTASECSSMDSAYQSQNGASRRVQRKPQGQLQENQTKLSNHFVSSDIYSPSLGSDGYPTFPEPALDMNPMSHNTTTGAWEATEGSMAYANYSTGQGYTQYTTASMPRFTPSTAVDVASQWATSETQFQNNPFTYNNYPTNSNNTEIMFNAASSQRQWRSNPYDAPERPSAVHRSSSYTVQEEQQRASAHENNFGTFIATPTSTSSMPYPQATEYGQSRTVITRQDTDETKSTSLPPLALDDEENTMSLSEAAETKLEEERTKVARSHPLYQQLPDKDGKYHCPEEGQTGCGHKPTALKCNYDKYVDSHLKPFRCNKKTCVGVQFSSTACLLRHEREAHGMHGHGARPHLCHFRDCERAVPGHGFPRRYNLFDHMKRVHQYEGPTTEPSPPAQGQAQRKTLTRKRKASAEVVQEKRQKVLKVSAEQLRQQRRDALTREFLSKKQHIIDVLSNLSSPSDLGDDIQLTKEVVGLHDICAQYRDSYGG